jgi:hypothetical protein
VIREVLKHLGKGEIMKFNGKRFEMTEEEYLSYEEEMVGLCQACGEERDSCEPDASEYECEVCGKRQVYGVPNLLIMGGVDIVDWSEEDQNGEQDDE